MLSFLSIPTRAIVATLALAAVMALHAATTHAETPQLPDHELAQAIHERVTRLAELRLERTGLLQAARSEEAELDTQLALLKEDHAQAEAQVASLTAKLNTERATFEATRQQSQALQAQLMESVAATRTTAQSVLADIRKGIPYQREQRTERMQKLIAAMNSSDWAEASSGMLDFWLLMAEEVRLGTSREFWNGLASPGDPAREVHAYQVRLGLAALIAVSEDGQEFARATHGSPSHESLSDTDKRVLREMTQMLRKQQPAAAQLLPLPLAASQGGAQ